MTWTNIQPMMPKRRRREPTARARLVFTGERDPALLGDLEGGLLLAPPDFPFVGGGPLLLGDVLVGLDDGLLDILEAAFAGVLVALLALVVAVGAGLFVLEPLLDVALQLEQRVHRLLLAHRARAADGGLCDDGVGLLEVGVDGRQGEGIL